MCGILGVVHPSAQHRQRFAAALDTIAHRGPDGAGHFADDQVLLGHRRLAIIDLHPRGHQPMIDAATGTVIDFNGEIYNYLELRRELQALGDSFVTETDTEVLLRAYLRWGPAALGRMNGMWAFVIWEPRHQRVFAARDRFGVKPFYYAVAGGAWLFASEPKALLALEPSLAEPSAAAIAGLFEESRAQSGTTSFFDRIQSLAPGHWLELDAAGHARRSGRYWEFPAPGEVRQSASERFDDLFEDAVRLRLRSDVEVGLTLSGGLDSSAVLAAAAATGARMRAFSSVYPGSKADELVWAERAAALGNAQLDRVEAPADEWLATLEKIVWHMDAPGYSPAVFPLWRIMARARAQNVPVLLEGQGADELLAGYPQYVPMANADLWRSRGVGAAGSIIRNLRGSAQTFTARWTLLWGLRSAFPGLSQRWRSARTGAALLRADVARETAMAEPGSARRSALHGRLFDDFTRDVLPALLHYGDAISMAHGIESRLPFLDYRLVEWVFGREPELIVEGKTKAPVRNYLAGRNFGIIASRRDKRGYPTPVADWLRTMGSPILRERLASRNEPLWDWFDVAEVARKIDAAENGDAGAVFHLYKLLTTDIWLRQLSEARIKSPDARQPASEPAYASPA